MIRERLTNPSSIGLVTYFTEEDKLHVAFIQEAEKLAAIYKIFNIENYNCYIGHTAKPVLDDRWPTHRNGLRRGDHHSKKLQKDWNEYGKESFRFIIIELCLIKDRLIREQFWIDYYQPTYNTLPVAGSTLGYKHTEEWKQERSRLYTGRKLTEEHSENISKALKGRIRSKEEREAISKGRIGLKFSDEHRENLRASHLGNSLTFKSEEGRNRWLAGLKKAQESPIVRRKGENHPNSKLTKYDVLSIRASANLYTLTSLAKRFEVSLYTIWDIVHYRSWKHVR